MKQSLIKNGLPGNYCCLVCCCSVVFLLFIFFLLSNNRTIGMFEQNNVGVRLENPVLTYIKQLNSSSSSALIEEIYSEVLKIRDSIEGTLSLFCFL
jgi:hypothetical protein